MQETKINTKRNKKKFNTEEVIFLILPLLDHSGFPCSTLPPFSAQNAHSSE